MAEQQLTCAGCGKQFTYHRRKAYCTTSCRPSRKPKTEVKLADAQCRQEHVCSNCDKSFKPKRAGRTKYCSRECFFEHKADKNDVLAASRVKFVVNRFKCVGCHVWFDGKPRQNRCMECKAEAWRNYYTVVEHADCRECGKQFSRSADAASRYMCSEECRKASAARSRRISKASRDALERKADRGQKIDPIKVFERDLWKCGICGRKTHKAKRGTYHDKAPELDHIVALANGGTHTWDNVQCACRVCNGAKNANNYGQLLLFPEA